MFPEGQKIGATVRKGYSNNTLTNETGKIVSSARDELNNSSLASQGNRLAQTATKGFNSEKFEISGTNSISRIARGIRENSNTVTNTTANTARQMNNSLDKNLTGYSSGSNYVSGIIRGITGNQWSLSRTISSLANTAMNLFKQKLGIHSPSREMMKISKFIPLGISKGIDENSDVVYQSINKLSRGIQINAKDMSIDTNQYVDYSAIQGQIQAQGNISISSNIVQGIAQAVSESMKNTDINVNIEARADEGVIVKKASQGFKEYVMQTGELPFPVPV